MDAVAVAKAQQHIEELARFHDELCLALGIPAGSDPEKILETVRETVAYAINK